MIGGAFQKWNGRLINHDLTQIARRAAESRDYILERAGLRLDREKVWLARSASHGGAP